MSLQHTSNYECKYLTDCSNKHMHLTKRQQILHCLISDYSLIKDYWTQKYAKQLLTFDTSLIYSNSPNIFVIASAYDLYYDCNMLVEELNELGISYTIYDCQHGGLIFSSKAEIIHNDIISRLL